MANILGLVAIGLAAGALSGLMGIGGGIIVIPALVYFFGFDQHRAAGTTLGLMIPPIGIFAVMEYYRKGFVDVRAAALICLGFLIGGLLGARFATTLSTVTMQRAFGLLLLAVGVKMVFWAR
jgi:uncharacterized membrane protein YfcA